MATNQTNQKSDTSGCGRIKNAAIFRPFQKTHRISHHPQSSNISANNPPLRTTDHNAVKPHVSQPKPGAVRQPGPGQLIRIESGAKDRGQKQDNGMPHGSFMNKTGAKILSTGQNNAAGKVDTVAKPKPEMPKVEPGKPFTVVPGGQLEPKMEAASASHSNDKISAYISRVRKTIRTSSDLGIERKPTMVTKRDSFNDRISNFLNRAKINLRTTSNVGDKRSTSFKEKGNIGHN